jgi:hypothetical protein
MQKQRAISSIFIIILIQVGVFGLGSLLLRVNSAHAAQDSHTNLGLDVCFVETTGDNITDYSSSDSSALQTAVDAANSEDLIKVAGTCAGVQVRNGLSQTVYISMNLTIQGGFANTSWLASSDPDVYETVLDAQMLNRVVYIASGTSVILDGLTIQNGDALVLGSNDGGGIMTLGDLELTNSRVINNNAYDGGGIFFQGTILEIIDSEIGYNQAFQTGGGLRNSTTEVSIMIENSLVISNTAGEDGGGMLIDGLDALTITQSAFQLNTARGIGGGLFLDNGGSFYIEHSEFVSNTAREDEGAGIVVYGTPGTIYNSRLASNSAEQGPGGGLFIAEGEALTLTHSTISSNDALTGGGGIRITDGAILNLINSTVSGNHVSTGSLGSAAGGGGISADSGQVYILHSTIVSNTAANLGVRDGIFITDTANLTLTASILANHSNDCANFSAFSDGGYNIVEDGSCITAGTSLSGDPVIGTLADNGGPSVASGAPNFTHALLSDSTAIDQVPAGICLVIDDQREVIRPVGVGCDIGAYEFNDFFIYLPIILR